MLSSEEQSAKREVVETGAKAVAVGEGPVAGTLTSATATGAASPVRSRRGRTWQLGSRWWMLAAGSALLLTMLTIAAVYLLTRKPSTIDQLIILTVPSGANVKLDSKDYGHTPVKLEQLVAGTYTLTIEKENFEPVTDQITINDTQTLEYKLKVLPSPDAVGSSEEVIRRFQDRANEALARNQYLIPYLDSAFYFAQQIERLDGSNAFAAELFERVRRTELQNAREATNSSDFGKAREIYDALSEKYPDNEEVRAAVAKFENQISQHRGEVGDLVKKATDALQAGSLVEPERASAYYYARRALAIDRQNAQARAVFTQIKTTLTARAEDADRRGDADAAIKQFKRLTQLFPDDKALRQQARDMEAQHAAEIARQNDAGARRVQGLDAYGRGEFTAAIADLEFAVAHNRATPDVIFALAYSYMKGGHLDQAASYFGKIQPSGDDQYRSAIAALGDIARERGDYAGALEKYKQAKQLGGSALYSIAKLDDRIEQIEKRERAKAAEPVPITIRAKHMHGGLMGGSCSGTLMIGTTGVRYEGGEHTFSANLLSAGVRIAKDEMVVKFQDKNEKFKVPRADAERFNEALSRFQQFYSPANK
ncbi:MAG TPA: PEGA domain-containing protein [Blastocatellia bacterium]|nr:PEGA domain-containing protein [Blastocatellia bacterium]